MRLI
ncbi:hypothetical protein F383_36399 [Gossypium arboreum]|jgi:SpoVK/Ycf46/Vps4 family AAA+-type ATPase